MNDRTHRFMGQVWRTMRATAANRRLLPITLATFFIPMMLWHGGALAQPNKVAQRPQVTAADAAATLGEMPLSTPGPVRVRAGTAQTASDAISVTVPLDLVVLTDRVNVGVISLTLSYDASLLSATACQLSDALTLLRCNIATPGQIRLAGVAPRGIRSAVNLAQLVFTPQQSINLTAPLTIQLDVVGDVDGAAVSTDSQAGAITLTCALNERCNGLNVYLPWVNR